MIDAELGHFQAGGDDLTAQCQVLIREHEVMAFLHRSLAEALMPRAAWAVTQAIFPIARVIRSCGPRVGIAGDELAGNDEYHYATEDAGDGW